MRPAELPAPVDADLEASAPDTQRALCLSGGGWRAALFHAGGLQRLNELGVLSQITTISTVSGGSVVAAGIVDAIATGAITWPQPGGPPVEIPGWDSITDRVRQVTGQNLRTPAWIRRLIRSGNMVDQLAELYATTVTPLSMADAPAHPRFIISATDMPFGVNWRFDLNPPAFTGPRMGSYRAGWSDVPSDWPIARTIAASSCFPPVFNPMELTIEPSTLENGTYSGDDRDKLVANIGLTDGGVYDNLGLEPIIDTHGWVLVSDGGAVIAPRASRWLGDKLLRYAAIQGSQGAATRKRWLVAQYQTEVRNGAYWSIHTTPAPDRTDFYRYTNEEARAIAQLRTDLDRFNDREAELLITHGYFQANAVADMFLGDIRRPMTALSQTRLDPPTVQATVNTGTKRTIVGRGAFIRRAFGRVTA